MVGTASDIIGLNLLSKERGGRSFAARKPQKERTERPTFAEFLVNMGENVRIFSTRSRWPAHIPVAPQLNGSSALVSM